jgi:hypothetical protein
MEGLEVTEGMLIQVCYSKCWSCMFDSHESPAKWHTWADFDDVTHALKQGLKDPTDEKCGCWCANEI